MSELEEQIAEQIAAVEGSLTSVDEVFGNLNTLEYDEFVKKMSSLDRAKYDLTNLYAINSLFWMYTRSFGEDPKSLPIKEELDRIKQQMMRVKQIGDKAKMPRVDKEVAQRMIRHGIRDAKHSGPSKQIKEGGVDEDWDQNANSASGNVQEPMETDTDSQSRGKKRKFPKPERPEGNDNNEDPSPSQVDATRKENVPHEKSNQNESVLSNSDDEYASAQE